MCQVCFFASSPSSSFYLFDFSSLPSHLFAYVFYLLFSYLLSPLLVPSSNLLSCLIFSFESLLSSIPSPFLPRLIYLLVSSFLISLFFFISSSSLLHLLFISSSSILHLLKFISSSSLSFLFLFSFVSAVSALQVVEVSMPLGVTFEAGKRFLQEKGSSTGAAPEHGAAPKPQLESLPQLGAERLPFAGKVPQPPPTPHRLPPRAVRVTHGGAPVVK